MAETDEETEITEEVVEETIPNVVYYFVRSAVRDRNNRTARAAQTGRRTFVQRFAGGTIVVRRARPARLSEAVLRANLEEFKRAVLEHRITVTTLSGQAVDLSTFEVGPKEATPPPPNPPLDSAKNDKNAGIGYDIPPTPEGTGVNAETPELLQSRIPEGTEPPPPPAPEAQAAEEVIPRMDVLPEGLGETPFESVKTQDPPTVRRPQGSKRRGDR